MNNEEWYKLIVIVFICGFLGCMLADWVFVLIAKHWIHHQMENGFTGLGSLFGGNNSTNQNGF